MDGSLIFILYSYLMVTLSQAYPSFETNSGSLETTINNLVDSDFIIRAPKWSESSSRNQLGDDINVELPVISNGEEGLRFRWPGGIIPVDDNTNEFTTKQQLVIGQVMDMFSRLTCIRFVPRVSEKHSDYFFIKKSSNNTCNSQLGLVTGRQSIVLNDECSSRPGVVLHLFMHTLGFLHEYNQPDRNSFVSNLSMFSDSEIAKINAMYKCNLPQADRDVLFAKEKRGINLYRCRAFRRSCPTNEDYPPTTRRPWYYDI